MNAQWEIFRRRWMEASGELVEVEGSADIRVAVRRTLEREGIRTVLLGNDLREANWGEFIAEAAGFKRLDLDESEALSGSVEARDGTAGVLRAVGLIAATGTAAVVVKGRTDRAAVCWPGISVLIADKAELFDDLAGFMARADAGKSYVLITGPSRTADIEKRLVLGAHAPGRVILVGRAEPEVDRGG